MIKERFLIKKIGLSATAVLIIFTFILSCAKKEEKEESSNAEKDVIKLVISDYNMEVAPPGQSLNYWAKWIEKESAGRVKVTVHHNAALLKTNEVYKGIQDGIADGGLYALDNREGFILNEIIELPFMGWPSQMATVKIYKELRQKFPELEAEWKGVKLLAAFVMPPTHIHTLKKPIRAPADLKGMKIYASEAMLANSVAAVGATPVTINIEEIYNAMDRGIVDGVINHFNVLWMFGCLDLPKYHTIFGDGGINMVPMTFILNPKKFNSLPPAIQKIIIDSGKVWVDKFAEIENMGAVHLKNRSISGVEYATEKKHKIIHLNDKEKDQWHKAIQKDVLDAWIMKAESKGLPGRAVYNETLKLIKKYQGQ